MAVPQVRAAVAVARLMTDCPLSIIVPVLNEVTIVRSALQALQGFRDAGVELIVVDGGSQDQTLAEAAGLADKYLQVAKGRARQMNAGAAQAKGRYLLFLHVDTRLQVAASQLCALFQANTHDWGFFPVRLSGQQKMLRVIERAMTLRSRLSSIATGDQCLYVRRELFMACGGYPEIALMEDIAICKRLRLQCRPGILPVRVVTSSRKWEQRGIIKTVLLMWRVRLAYFLGVDPGRLAKVYYD
jgi:rSAM/selenodomain-associated transferase 2